MNKRQLKKNKKKYILVIADEYNLLTMTDDERENAYTEYANFVRKYAFRKKYKNLKGKLLTYFYPIGNQQHNWLTEVSKRTRKRQDKALAMVTQNISDFLPVNTEGIYTGFKKDVAPVILKDFDNNPENHNYVVLGKLGSGISFSVNHGKVSEDALKKLNNEKNG